MKKHIPIALILFRLSLAPILIILTAIFGKEARILLISLIVLGLLSDILDGIFARHLNVSSERLRRMDSQTDMLFWLAVGWCSWLLHPEIIQTHAYSIAMIFFMEILTYVLSISKFGKETCTHAFLSKIWGLTLCAAFIGIIGFGYGGVTLYLAVIFGLISHIDVILIILILPKWTHDIPSAYHAYLIRKGKTFKKNKLLNG